MNVASKCNMLSCGGKHFPSIEKLMTHLINFHQAESRECIFLGCSSKFPAGKTSTARNHFSSKHKKTNQLVLKPRHIIGRPFEACEVGSGSIEAIADDDVVNDEMECGQYSNESDLYTAEDLDDIDEHTRNENDSNYFMMQYEDYMNRLCNTKYIPHTTVQEISNEYLANSLKSQEVKEKKLRSSLQSVPQMTESQINKIVQEVIEDDDFLKAQRELNTGFKRTKFIQKNFNYIPPIEIVLNKEAVLQGEVKDCVHYVPVTESFCALMEDKSLSDVLERSRNTPKKSSDIIKDLTDGEMFKKNQYFKDNPGALAGHFYSDSVELSNPLGAAKGKHKINQVFYTVAQIPKEQRSQIDRMQLCMVYKDKLVKKYGYHVIFKPLIEDLLKLESGITINLPFPRLVQLGVLAYSGDNLESHNLGGFSCCFSSKDICRFCHATYLDLDSHIHDYDSDKPHDYWTTSEYDKICDALEEEE